MTARKCYKQHSTQGISSSGIDNRLFGYMRHDFYCPVCNKGRTIYNLWINIRLPRTPKLFVSTVEDDSLPY